jgi:hypothetical protein
MRVGQQMVRIEEIETGRNSQSKADIIPGTEARSLVGSYCGCTKSPVDLTSDSYRSNLISIHG